MLTSSGGRSMLRGGGGGKICQNLADVICERSLKTLETILDEEIVFILDQS